MLMGVDSGLWAPEAWITISRQTPFPAIPATCPANPDSGTGSRFQKKPFCTLRLFSAEARRNGKRRQYQVFPGNPPKKHGHETRRTFSGTVQSMKDPAGNDDFSRPAAA